jgi:hypothetical protein
MGNVENRLGQERSRHAGSIMRRAAPPMPDGHTTVQLQHRHCTNELLMAIAYRPQLLP